MVHHFKHYITIYEKHAKFVLSPIVTSARKPVGGQNRTVQ